MAPPTYYAIVLREKCSDEAAQFIVDKIVLGWDEGGAGLQVAKQPVDHAFPDTVLHITADNRHIFRIADIMEVKKPDNDGYIRPVTVEEMDEFPQSGRVGPLTIADVQRCVLHAMERVHFPTDVRELPGHPGKSVMKRAPVLDAYKEKKLIEMFPVHDDEELQKIYKSWKITKAPIEEIRNYFGEGTALYFSFAQHYTKFLVLIAAFGLTEFFLEQFFSVNHVQANVLFSFANLIVVGVFLETWKRRGNEHSFFWGTQGKLRLKPPRPEYRGELRINPITERQEMYYPYSKTRRKLYLVSIPLTIFCLVMAFWMMLNSFWAEIVMTEYLHNPETDLPHDDLLSTILGHVPSVSYSLLVLVGNSRYMKLARRLTEWENHRTQQQHDAHLASKLVLFEFVNTFLALFYIGFWLGDLPALRSQLLTTLVVSQVVNQVQEVVVPLFLHKPASRRLLEKVTEKLGVAQQPVVRNLDNISELVEDDPRVAIVRHDLMADPLESLHDDFMEMWLQFGHVFLFMAVYPLAALFALFNNLLEAVAERYKMCRLSRKPRPRATRDIGTWFTAFQLTSVVAVMTNCSLLAIDLKETAGQEWTRLEWFALFVIIEHLFMVVFVIVDKVIPDVPKHVKYAMDKTDFHFRQKPIRDTHIKNE